MPNQIKFASIFLFGIFLFGCATKKKEVWQSWPSAHPTQRNWMDCSATSSIKMKSDGKATSFDSLMEYRYRAGNSELNLQILSPFRSQLAVIEVNPKRRIWKDGTGTHSLSDHPEFNRWLKKDWWEALNFLFGRVTAKVKKRVLVDASGRPRVFQYHMGNVECEYDKTGYPESCEWTNRHDSLHIDFSFSECQDSIR